MEVNLILNALGFLSLISYSDSARECSLLEDPLNGRVDVYTYRHGGIATYSCDEGYRLQGPDRAICLTNGEFEPREPPICRPVICEEVYYLANGRIDHINDGKESNSYMTYNMYHCNQGYRIKGPSERRCGGNGQWEGDDPYCEEILCDPLGHLDNGRIDYDSSKLSSGTVAFFECNENSDMQQGDSDYTRCTTSGTWSYSKPKCLGRAEIYPIPRGTIYVGTSRRPLEQGISVPHGTKIRLICNTKSELYSTTDRRYMNRRYPSFSSENNNGTWTPPIPECVFKRCDLNKRKYQNYKFTFTNRTDVPPKVDHNTELLGSCSDRHEFDDKYADNPSIYTCNKDHIRLDPRCVPAFCSVSLPDDMYIDEGTADLIDDIERIRHGTEIFYRCHDNSEYELFLGGGNRDSVSDTCDHGQWVKKVKPICREKRCYLHANEGAMFAGQQGNTVGNRYIESRTNISINCENGFRLTDDGHPIHNDNLGQYSTCLKGKWSRNLRCEPEPCELPVSDSTWIYDEDDNFIQHSKDSIESEKTIRIKCITGFSVVRSGHPVLSYWESTCSKGNWSTIHQCEPKPCRFDKQESSNFWLGMNRKEELRESRYIPSGTRVFISCQSGFRLTLTKGEPVPGDEFKYADCFRGDWKPIYQCEKVICGRDQWRCRTGECIDNARRCDSIDDCDDGSDEDYEQCDVRVCNEGLVACPQPDGSEICVEDTTGCATSTTTESISQNYSNTPNTSEIYSTTESPQSPKMETATTNNPIEASQLAAPCRFDKHVGSDYWLVENRKKLLSKSQYITSGTRVYISCHKGYSLELRRGDDVDGHMANGRMVKYADCYRGKWKRFYQCKKDNTSHAAGSVPTTYENTTPESQSGSTEYAASTTTIYYDSDIASAEFEFVQTDSKGCVLPSRLNSDEIQIQMSGEYQLGDRIPHGYSFDISCWMNYETENETLTCKNGTWEYPQNCGEDIFADGQSRCNITNGSADLLHHSVYSVSCNTGYKMSVTAEYFVCEDGYFYPEIIGYQTDSSSGHVTCIPENCLLPYEMPFNLKIQNMKGTYYSSGSEVKHTEKINITCDEGFEPHGREFRCIAGEVRPIDSDDWYFMNLTGSLTCRKAICAPGCHSGVCNYDKECRCDGDHYGRQCEKVYCRLSDDMQHTPFKEKYTDGTPLHNVTCSDQTLQYQGPRPLICQPDGSWNGKPSCHLIRRTFAEYRIHFVGHYPDKVKVSQHNEQITLYGDGVQTTSVWMDHDETYKKNNNWVYIFKFTAEYIDYVKRITLTSPFQRNYIREVKLELRKNAVVYSALYRESRLLEQGQEYILILTRRREYSKTYVQKKLWPRGNWVQRWKRYIFVFNAEACELICTHEKSFTCAALIFRSDYGICYTFSYSTVDHPEYFYSASYTNMYFYERELALQRR